MGILEKLFSWVRTAVSYVQYAIDLYKSTKAKFPGLFEFIESLYNEYAPQVADPNNPLTGLQARTLVEDRVLAEFTNSPTSIPKWIVSHIIEVIHGYHNTPEMHRFDHLPYNVQAEKVLKGLKNKYGDR